MGDIAAEAGLATGTLYNYFKSKEEVFRSLLERRGTEFLQALDEVSGSGLGPLETIAELIRATFADLEKNRAIYALFAEIDGGSESSLCRVGKEVVERIHGDFLERYRRPIARAASDGLLRDDVPVDQLAALLTGAMRGIAARWIATGETGNLAASADVVLDFFTHGASPR